MSENIAKSFREATFILPHTVQQHQVDHRPVYIYSSKSWSTATDRSPFSGVHRGNDI